MSNMSKLKCRLKSEWNKNFENGMMRKVAQFAQDFSKNLINFYHPKLLQCMQKIWVNFCIKMDFGVVFNLKNA